MTAPASVEAEPTTPADTEPRGLPPGWRGPILPVNTRSGDPQDYVREYVLIGDEVPQRPLPRPLHAQEKLAEGHDGAVVVGVITRLWVQDGQVWGEGTFDLADPVAADWAGKLQRGYAGWVSVDFSDIAVTQVPLDADSNEVPSEALTAFQQAVRGDDPSQWPDDPVAECLWRIDRWKIAGVTMLSQPAYEQTRIEPVWDVQAMTAAAEPDTADAEPEDAAGSEHTGAMIALVPAADDAQRLAVEGGEPVEELHLTLAYLGEAADWSSQQVEAVRAAIGEIVPSGPVLGEIWGHALFNPNSTDMEPCAVYLAGADGLTDLRQAVLGALMDISEMPEQHDPFVPHVTAGYGLAVEQLTESGAVRFDRVRIAFAGTTDDIPLEPVTAALTAAAVVYDRGDFEMPEPDEITALTITADGRVFGHLAAYDSCHIGFAEICVSPPVSASAYAYFHQGEIRTDAGALAVGKITLGTGHASLHASARAAAEHYDNTGSAVAVVRARDGALGPWLSGRILPGVTDDRVDELRRSGISGDWRGIRRNSTALELVAVLAVNVPGFPVPRTRALAASGFRSLVAAGIQRRRTVPVPARLVLDDLIHRRRTARATLVMRSVRADCAAGRLARAGKERHVRSPEGAKKYGKPIGSPIKGGAPDAPGEEPAPRSRNTGMPSMPPIRELFDQDEDQLLRTFRAGFNGPYGREHEGQPPLQLQMLAVETETGRNGQQMIHAAGHILDANGQPVGRVQRTFYLESDGEVHVEHALLNLDEEVRGRGFSTDLFQNLSDYYERSGATRINIFAGDDDGGWAWARTGFEWNNANGHMTGTNRANMMRALMNVHADPTTSARDQDLTHQMLMRFSGPPAGWPAPTELSNLAGDNPDLGEQILRGSEWYGVMWL